ncbi:MAG: transporter substrate-binding protein [Deltaproteobacteria bacterium]|nr:transporter substrate-binding protein [Deltaproteobacteria bacterium]
MLVKKTLPILASLFLLHTSFGSFASAQLARLNVGYSAISADQLPAWVAKDAGIFAKYGLDVQLIFFTGGSTAILALVSGDVPITQVSGPGLVSSGLGGSDAVFVAGGSRFGSATDSIARFALKKVGLSVGKDVTLIQVGSGPERLGALQTGRVTAAVINPPSSFIAEKRGMAVIADVAQMGLVFQHTGAATTKKFIREHNDIVRRYVRAHVEAVHRMWTDKEATIRALGKYMGSGLEREILEKSWENVMHETLYPKKQYPSLEGLKTVIEDLAERDPRAKTVKPEQFVDMSFIRELDQSGFTDGLYKKK